MLEGGLGFVEGAEARLHFLGLVEPRELGLDFGVRVGSVGGLRGLGGRGVAHRAEDVLADVLRVVHHALHGWGV